MNQPQLQQPAAVLPRGTLVSTSTREQKLTPQLDRLFEAVIGRGASDLHLNVGSRPRIRLNGAMVELETKVLTAEDTASLFRGFGIERVQVQLNEEGSANFSYDYQGKGRFRVNACHAYDGIKLSLRRLPNKLFMPSEIGLPKRLIEISHQARGLVLVTGPTGSGKTTTLASLVNELAQTESLHVITIEEPTEYVIPHGKSLVTQREVPVNVPSFQRGLVDALREDPDVIVVGEMRDVETMRTAVSAAETGHMVFATLHTSSAWKTVDRIVDACGNEGEKNLMRAQLSTSLKAVLCQQLLPRSDGSGRIAAFEFMVVNAAIANLIRFGKTHAIPGTIQTSAKDGMRLLDDHLLELVDKQLVEFGEAHRRANEPAEFLAAVRARSGKK